MKDVLRKIVRYLLLILIEEIQTMSLLDDAIAGVSAKLDTLAAGVAAIVANESADAGAVTAAQAAQAAAEAALVTVQGQLADATANAVTDDQIAAVTALGAKADAILPAPTV